MGLSQFKLSLAEKGLFRTVFYAGDAATLSAASCSRKIEESVWDAAR